MLTCLSPKISDSRVLTLIRIRMEQEAAEEAAERRRSRGAEVGALRQEVQARLPPP